ncbi:hypothetical protein [Kitasatospora sp. NPDC050463]|uniref:hypothetical protein n=1 Tax=Kitasatospora sp. NPDC050463 TaxID=3155786 RepID=UPI00340A1008
MIATLLAGPEATPARNVAEQAGETPGIHGVRARIRVRARTGLCATAAASAGR